MSEPHLPPPTRGNLSKSKKALELSNLGFELLDRKRTLLLREMMGHLQQARDLRSRLHEQMAKAYRELEQANIALGLVEEHALCIPVEDSIRLFSRRVVGVALPTAGIHPEAPGYTTDWLLLGRCGIGPI
jgi:V/A-type H+-transporting ATPase subunit D